MPSTSDRYDNTVTVSLFNFDNRRSMLNVSVRRLLKLQLSRLFSTRSVDFSHFEIPSLSTGMVETKSGK